MLKISETQSVAHTILDVDCPQCGVPGIVTLTRFINAVNRNDMWHCSDCGCDFKIEFVRLTRSAELRDEAVRAGADESPKDLRTEDK